MREFLQCPLLALVLTTSAFGGFVNGGFEAGDFTGWTQGAGYWSGDLSQLDPVNYLPGGVNFDISYNASQVVAPALDPNTDNHLNSVYSGGYAARVNDSYQNNSVAVISQTVSGYTDPSIYFAWAAVLENSHGATDSDNFRLKLTNDTAGITLYDVTYNSATAPPGLFTYSSNGWYYTDWQVQQLDVSRYSGDTFTLTLLGSDCRYGGHSGYVYLDGFGAIAPPSGVPEPATFVLIGLGLAGFAAMRFKRR